MAIPLFLRNLFIRLISQSHPWRYRSWGICVDLPEPVSPVIITTWWDFTLSTIWDSYSFTGNTSFSSSELVNDEESLRGIKQWLSLTFHEMMIYAIKPNRNRVPRMRRCHVLNERHIFAIAKCVDGFEWFDINNQEFLLLSIHSNLLLLLIYGSFEILWSFWVTPNGSFQSLLFSIIDGGYEGINE